MITSFDPMPKAWRPVVFAERVCDRLLQRQRGTSSPRRIKGRRVELGAGGGHRTLKAQVEVEIAKSGQLHHLANPARQRAESHGPRQLPIQAGQRRHADQAHGEPPFIAPLLLV
jgi:hypothetical protein